MIKRRYKTKVNKSFSSWEELIKGVPQRSVFGPILFNIWFIFNEWSYLLINDSYLINDSFYLANFSEIYNFADGTTFHACHNDLNNLIKRLKHKVFLALEWFEINNMKLSKNKCHLLVSGISIKMFGLKWGIKNLGKCTTNITWNGNRKKSSFWWCDFTI